MSVLLPKLDCGQSDVFIDDIVTFGIDSPENRPRLLAATPLAIDTVARPIDPCEPLPRNPFISATNATAEGALEETKTVLGWVLNTRRFTISLPSHKFVAWSSEIKHILSKGSSNLKELERVLGRLSHAASILPMARHFLSRIRYANSRMYRHEREYKLNKNVLADLQLCLEILAITCQGISMNLLVFRLPIVAYFPTHPSMDWVDGVPGALIGGLTCRTTCSVEPISTS